MTQPSLRVTVDGAVARVTIDRPDRMNAVDVATLLEIGRVVDALTQDETVGVAMLEGAAEVFCAGADVADLGALLDRPDTELRAEFGAQLRVLECLQAAPFATVAAVDGVAYGIGVALAASCDQVVATQRAQFALPEIRFGMAPAMVLSPLMRRLSAGAALRLALSGRAIDATEAQRAGLVDHVVEDDALDETATSLVEDLAGASVDALRQTVRLVRDLASGASPDLALESWRAVRAPSVAARLADSGHGPAGRSGTA